jgi:aminopeptidase N
LGLDRLAQRRANIPVTTDDLQAIMEETSGQDLADFFDFWVHGGRIPKVKVRYALVAGADETMTVEGCIESDVPFGSYDLPVSIEDGGGEVAALVDIDNGSGAFTVPGRTGEVTVKVDPKRQMLLYTRDVELSANAPECGG